MRYDEITRWLSAQQRWAWTAPLWTREQVIAEKDGKIYTVKDLQAPMHGITRLGCGGFENGRYKWLGYDFDVGAGHGSRPFNTQLEALLNARKLRHSLSHLQTLLATSSRGKGIHLFALVDGLDLKTRADVKNFNAYFIPSDVYPDQAPLTAQRFFLFNRNCTEANLRIGEDDV